MYRIVPKSLMMLKVPSAAFKVYLEGLAKKIFCLWVHCSALMASCLVGCSNECNYQNAHSASSKCARKQEETFNDCNGINL